jgi:hypothetical protein
MATYRLSTFAPSSMPPATRTCTCGPSTRRGDLDVGQPAPCVSIDANNDGVLTGRATERLHVVHAMPGRWSVRERHLYRDAPLHDGRRLSRGGPVRLRSLHPAARRPVHGELDVWRSRLCQRPVRGLHARRRSVRDRPTVLRLRTLRYLGDRDTRTEGRRWCLPLHIQRITPDLVDFARNVGARRFGLGFLPAPPAPAEVYPLTTTSKTGRPCAPAPLQS